MATVGGAETQPLQGLHLVMDCANGAAYQLAPQIFRALGARLTVLNADAERHQYQRGVRLHASAADGRDRA